MTVSEAFLSAGIQPPVRDEWFTAPCPGCGNKQNLGTAARRRNHGYTEYACARCEAVLVVIGPAPGQPLYKPKEYAVNSAAGMRFYAPGAAAPLLYP